MAFLRGKTGISADPSVQCDAGAPPIPRIENIHQRVYQAINAEGCQLRMSNWHTCETTHCRAGWVVTLAGEAGKKLEAFYNTELAAMLIYRESGYHINPARFYDADTAAMADITRLAETGRAQS
jgi:hypothetical protein